MADHFFLNTPCSGRERQKHWRQNLLRTSQGKVSAPVCDCHATCRVRSTSVACAGPSMHEPQTRRRDAARQFRAIIIENNPRNISRGWELNLLSSDLHLNLRGTYANYSLDLFALPPRCRRILHHNGVSADGGKKKTRDRFQPVERNGVIPFTFTREGFSLWNHLLSKRSSPYRVALIELDDKGSDLETSKGRQSVSHVMLRPGAVVIRPEIINCQKASSKRVLSHISNCHEMLEQQVDELLMGGNVEFVGTAL